MPPYRYTSGVRVVDGPGQYPLIVATRPFAAGEMVLVEPPLITFSTPKQAVLGFMRLSDKKKEQYLETRHVNLAVAPPKHRQCYDFSMEYLSCAPGIADKLNGALSIEKVAEVLSVTQFNCFTFDAAGQMYSETSGTAPSPMAVYYLGGKILNSCDANTIYTSSVYPGSGSFVALYPIAEGEVITVGIVDCMDGTVVRRRSLVSQRDFFCECSRCMARDISAGIACEQPGCSGTKFGFHRTADDTTLRDYECDACGDTTMPDLSVEEQYSQQRSSLRMQLQMSPDTLAVISRLEEVIHEAQRQLCPTHFVVVRMLKMLSRAYCSYAIFLETTEDKKKSPHYRFKSAKTGADAVKVMECIGAQCKYGLRCNKNHPPRIGKPETILWVCMDSLKCSSSSRRSLYPVIEKYIPFMRSVYGEDDDDLCKVQEMLRQAGRLLTDARAEEEEREKARVAEQMLEQLLLEEAQGQTQKHNKKKGKKKKGSK